MRENCEYCGKSLIEYDDEGNRTTRVKAKFDSNTCRDKYWADMRRLQRAYVRAEKAAMEMVKLSQKTNKIAETASKQLNALLTAIERAGFYD